MQQTGVSEKNKSSVPSENTIFFNKDNLMRKQKFTKKPSEHVDQTRTLTLIEKISMIFLNWQQLRKIEKQVPLKKYTKKDRCNIGEYVGETVQ